jgi:hypothetical protein
MSDRIELARLDVAQLVPLLECGGGGSLQILQGEGEG